MSWEPPAEVHPKCPEEASYRVKVGPCAFCRQLHFEDWVQEQLKNFGIVGVARIKGGYAADDTELL